MSHDLHLSPPGESLSIAEHNGTKWVIVTPLSLPGERIRARVYRHSRLHSHADLLEILVPNPNWRDMSRVQCQYFGTCAGCQYQMLSYEQQLNLKRDTVVEAYNNYSTISPEFIPPIQSTIGSPLQYHYRTKLTPHFQRPPFSFQKAQKRGDAPVIEGKPDWLKIGFHQVGTRHVMDIEECPIATPVINKALGPVRDNVIKNVAKLKNGATLLLRDSLSPDSPADDIPVASGSTVEEDGHVCVTDQKGAVRERVGDMLFEYTAGTFFQNNNSALVPLTSYVRDAAFPATDASEGTGKPTHLVDAYCGSGLFSIMLARHFDKVAGIELSAESIRAAQRNAELNALSADKISFMAGDAANIFDTVLDFPRERTVLVIDPPRKGTDERFIEQMIAFGASTVVYVSCNVHTQARDVGQILQRSEAKAKEQGGKHYVLESLRGLDLFPQTAHVEAIAVMRLV
ncbi:S-adenosyl-L-methionine-dependent methyltransferase [Ganoderma leucocontextum]|nr:S-adenosyl-L-methionine-dependent methyltransferase [Ganoderma leucocontextum]